MIHVSDIIRAIGGSEKDYPDAQVRLFDDEDQEWLETSVTYSAPLFLKNPDAKEEFESCLRTFLTNLPNGDPLCMQITADAVILNYRSRGNSRVFMRKCPKDQWMNIN